MIAKTTLFTRLFAIGNICGNISATTGTPLFMGLSMLVADVALNLPKSFKHIYPIYI
jgi:hypothetical protein